MVHNKIKKRIRRFRRKIRKFPLLMVILVSLTIVAGGLFIRWCSNPAQYDGRQKGSASELDTRARNFFFRGQTDSAVIYFTHLTNYYNDASATPEERELACHAHTSMGNIYTNYYCDYPKAMQHLLLADSLANKYGMENELCNIYLAQTNLRYEILNMDGNFNHSPELCSMFSKSFHQARGIGNLYLENVAFVNLAYLLIKNDNIENIRKELSLITTDIARYRADSIRSPHAQRLFPDSVILTGYMTGLTNGITLYLKGDYRNALEKFKSLSTQTTKLNAKSRTRYNFIANTAVYKTLMQLNNPEKGGIILDSLYQSAIKVDLMSIELEALSMMLNHYKTNPGISADYELQFFKKKDEYIRNAKLAQVLSVQLEGELDRTRDQINSNRRHYNIVLWIFGIVVIACIVLLILLLLLNGKYKAIKLKNYRLYRKFSQRMEVSPPPAESAVGTKTKYARNNMALSRRRELAESIINTFESSPEIYSSDFSLRRLSEIIGANANDVSQVINQTWNKNFNTLLAEYRIREACNRLKPDSGYSHMTVEGVAASVGIRSRSNFSKLFKQVTGLTPSTFMRIATEETAK